MYTHTYECACACMCADVNLPSRSYRAVRAGRTDTHANAEPCSGRGLYPFRTYFDGVLATRCSIHGCGALLVTPSIVKFLLTPTCKEL